MIVLRLTEPPVSWITLRQTKLAKQRAPLVEHCKLWQSIVLFDVDPWEAELTRSLSEGWPWIQTTASCSRSLWTKTIHLEAPWNRCWQFSPDQQDMMFDWSGAGSDCSFPIEPQPADIFTVFNKSHSWLVRPYHNLFIYPRRQKSINSQ